MEKMMTAKEASELSVKNRDEAAERQLSGIMECIYDACEDGLDNIYIGYTLTESTVRSLRALGYSVANNTNQFDGPMYTIHW